jgi:hypothetical protein
VKNNGYWLSVEAIVSMALLASLLSMPMQESGQGFSGLQMLKKENDLLLLWARGHESTGLAKMGIDFKKAFPGKSGIVSMDGTELAIGTRGTEAVASSVSFFDRQMQRHELSLVVFKGNFS